MVCILRRNPGTENMMDFTAVIRLCYMMQLTLRNEDYPGGPDQESFKGRVLFGSWQKNISGLRQENLTHSFGLKDGGNKSRQLLEAKSGPQLPASKETGPSNPPLQVTGFSQQPKWACKWILPQSLRQKQHLHLSSDTLRGEPSWICLDHNLQNFELLNLW